MALQQKQRDWPGRDVNGKRYTYKIFMARLVAHNQDTFVCNLSFHVYEFRTRLAVLSEEVLSPPHVT